MTKNIALTQQLSQTLQESTEVDDKVLYNVELNQFHVLGEHDVQEMARVFEVQCHEVGMG